MWPAAALAHAAGSLEANAPAEFIPMSRIQVAEISPDRHGAPDLANLTANDYTLCRTSS
jgi:hypothetical protein